MTTTGPPENCLVAVGDIMLGDSAICVGFGFHSRYHRDMLRAFAGVRAHLQRGDLVYGNLECLLTTKGRGSTRLETVAICHPRNWELTAVLVAHKSKSPSEGWRRERL